MPPPWHLETDTTLVRKICVGPYENNAYVVACATTREAVIVDAAAETDRLVAATADVSPIAILTTHGHTDHVTAARQTSQRLGIPFLMQPADADIAGFEPDEPLEPGPFSVGRLSLDVVATPGHTPGSTCFMADGLVFSGDTLFPGGPGATAFPYSSFEQVVESIEQTLFALGDTTIVMPGHGLDTTIGTERPSLPAWRARGW